MEQQEITQRVHELLEEIGPILKEIYKGFVKEKIDLLKDSRLQFRECLKKRLPGVEMLIQERDKSEAVQKFLIALPHLQRVGLAVNSLIDKMELKAETKTLLSQKAIDEMKQLMEAVGKEFNDVKDYYLTKNPILKQQVETDMEKVRQLVDDFDIIHQNRLIGGMCVPQASYLYIDMTDSLKRMARELAAFADKA
jgi:Na+/phosphate symporter